MIEVVSPNSATMDRVAKAALYAQADIPFCWRVETVQGIVMHTCRLDQVSGVYVPTGEFPDVLAVGEPWPVEVPRLPKAPQAGTKAHGVTARRGRRWRTAVKGGTR